MKTFKKLFSVAAIVALLGTLVPMYAFGANYNEEMQSAYAYAHAKGITTMTSIDNADMFGGLTRIAMAKMIANYAINVLGLEPDTSKACTFTDVSAALDKQYDNGVTLACQLGLMGQNITAFRPNDPVIRAEFGTTLSRALNANDADKLAEMNAADPYYKEHLNYLKNAGIMTNISNPSMTEVRGYVMLMMMRADDNYSEASEGCSVSEILACFGEDDSAACLAACGEAGEEEENTDPEEVKAGTLNVTMKSEEGGDVVADITSLPVVTYTMKATDEDVNISSLVLKQAGYGENATIDQVALFINGQRVSKIKPTDNLNPGKETTINLSSSYTVKAGKSVDIEVRVTLGNKAAANGHQFAIELINVNSSAEKVKLPSNAKSNTFKVVNQNARAVTLTNKGGLSNPKVGATNANIFAFEVDNTDTVTSKEDVKVSSITLMAVDSAAAAPYLATNAKDFADYIENIKLTVDGKVIAKAEMNGKYLTFNFDEEVVVKEGKKTKFTVSADIIGGANRQLNFTMESAMDASVMGNTNNLPVNITPLTAYATALGISAGRVTIERTNPTSTTFAKNAKNVFLGSFTISNNESTKLRLEHFTLNLADGETTLTAPFVKDYVDAVKVKVGNNGGYQTLDCTWTSPNYACVYNEDDIMITSSTTIYVYADFDSAAIITTDDQFTMTLPKAGIFVYEDESDEAITSISAPSAWTLMEGSTSSLKVTANTLSTETYANKTQDIDAVSFNVKTNSNAGMKISSIVFTPTASLDEDDVVAAKLFVGEDEYDVTLGVNGVVTCDNTIELPANSTTTFVLNVDLGTDPDNSIQYKLTTIEANDTTEDENPFTYAGTPVVAGRTINTVDNGTLTVYYENINSNKYAKSILGGTSETIMEYGLKANYEQIKAGTIIVTFDRNNIKDRLENVELYYGDTKVAVSPDWDTNGKIATFADADLVIDTTKTPLTVKVTAKKFNADGDVIVNGATATVSFDKVKGKESGNTLTAGEITSTTTFVSKKFDLVPATLTAEVKSQSATKTELTLTLNKGDNTRSSNSDIRVYLRDLGFNAYVADGDLLQAIVRLGSEQLAVIKYSATDISDADTFRIGTTNYYRDDLATDSNKWELSAGENTVTLIYQAKNTDVSYVLDATNFNYVADMGGTITDLTTLLTATPIIDNRLQGTLNLVTK